MKPTIADVDKFFKIDKQIQGPFWLPALQPGSIVQVKATGNPDEPEEQILILVQGEDFICDLSTPATEGINFEPVTEAELSEVVSG